MRQGQSIWVRLGKALQREMDIAHEPLPRRWVELIHQLDEQERTQSSLSKCEDQVQVASRRG
jgi:hypothetical protein